MIWIIITFNWFIQIMLPLNQNNVWINGIIKAQTKFGLLHLWHVESNTCFFPETSWNVDSSHQRTRFDCLSVISGPENLVAPLRKNNKCLPLYIIQFFKLHFLMQRRTMLSDNDVPKCSRAHVHHGRMMVSRTIPPESSMVTRIQQRFLHLACTHQDFLWLPEYFHNIMNCGWWKT